MTIRTRFAPSPTGFLHIGGARTALFNYLFARRHGGEFLLRIEDTDLERSTPEAVRAILDGMDWLGLTSDRPVVYQASRKARHIECAEQMLANGTAFKCYVTQNELLERRERGQSLRLEAKADEVSDTKRAQLLKQADELLAPYRSPYRDQSMQPPSVDAPYTVRLKAPDNQPVAFTDAVQGALSVEPRTIDDLVLLRADGTPTYMLAVVVDDHDMDITHVIRGDDHLNNTYRQIPIYKALGWKHPEFAHVPLILGPDGKKYSKRHGAQGIEGWRDLGYLPEGLRNYLLRLGWAHGDLEIIPDEDAIQLFDLEGLNKSAARMDLEKLGFINAHYLKTADDARVLQLVSEQIQITDVLSQKQTDMLTRALPTMKSRGATIVEIADACKFLLEERPIDFSQKSLKKLKSDAPQHLENLKHQFDGLSAWNSEEIDRVLQSYAETAQVGMGRFGPALRLAMTGGLPAPDLGLVLEWFGKTETLERVADLINTLTAGPSRSATDSIEG